MEYTQPVNRPDLDIGNFATALFQWAHLHSLQLDVLAWGIHGKGIDISKINAWGPDEDVSEPVPQLFFIKRQEYLQYKEDRIFASRTTRGRIRDEFPGLILPTFDPGF